MLYHLGWTDPAQGLLRWEREGFASTHSVLRMMKAIWQDTGLLDDYLFERLRVGARPGQIAGWLKPSYKVRGGGFGDFDNLNSSLRKRRASRNHEHPDTASGMHLDYERHNSAPTRFATSDRADAPYFIWEDAHSAVNHSYLFTTSMIGWYRIMMDGPLADFEQTRTPVTVINEAVGTLGTFHRSPITGLAYVGDHDVHRWGNPNEGEQLLYA